ncbi:flagellin [Limnohabitans sp. Rim8]|uniref:flagellin N-terminal helical domain-containing protein n=1 Tax=Limnohabitans sp. Rim8 TaxID=1100718 RepID=UPI0025E93AEA|nr:flagellin [Limnohabitans sp. Rim8]
MSVINTNIKSLVSQNALNKNNDALASALQQLSTGTRINSAADDAAGLAISSRMTAQIRGLDQAVRNANDGISLLQTSEGALIEVTNMMQRMRELSVQAANDTNTASDRTSLNLEYGQLMQEINRVAQNTQWNGMNIMNNTTIGTGGTLAAPATAGTELRNIKFQVGSNANQTISAQLKDFTIPMTAAGIPDTATVPAATQIFSGTARLNDTDITSVSNASTAMTRLDAALGKITDERATYGAVINRLTYALDNLTNVAQNTTESRSRIMDTDYAKASSELARTQIISQAATAMLAQANQSPQSVLQLLQG